MRFTNVAALASVLGLAAASPHGHSHMHHLARQQQQKRDLWSLIDNTISELVEGLQDNDAVHMQKIGMAYQGENSKANNGKVWIGDDGPNKFTYTNKANVPVTLVLWVTPTGDYEAAFMNVRRAAVTYSMKPDESITLSLANGISGAWAYLFNEKTILSNGYVFESWGEYTTGAYATVDHSMLPNTKGNPQTITVKDTGCVSDSTRCYFACIDESVESCGYGKGEVKLVNCDPSSQPGANYGLFGGEPQGGCTGFSNGGEVDIVIGQ